MKMKLMRGGSVLPAILRSFHAKQANMVSNVSTSKEKAVEKLLMETGPAELVLQFYRNALSKCVLMNDEELMWNCQMKMNNKLITTFLIVCPGG